MIVRVQLFAVARDLAGRGVVEIELPEGGTVSDLRRALAAEVPSLAPVLPRVLVAVGADYARDSAVLQPGDEVACIPPVSGG